MLRNFTHAGRAQAVLVALADPLALRIRQLHRHALAVHDVAELTLERPLAAGTGFDFVLASQ